MATSPTPAVAAPAHPPGLPPEIRIVSHSNLFYWWPVWAVGFLMAGMTYFAGNSMVVVPKGTEAIHRADVVSETKKLINRDTWVLPEGKAIPKDQEAMRVSGNKNLGVLFSMVLLLVIGITNIPLRGLWSVIVIVFIISLSIIFALLDWWEKILAYLSILDIRISFEGYMMISSVLFVLWLLIFVFFDRQIYMVFTPGQLRVRLEIGDAETAYDTTGMTIQKQRSDLFRHWILGLGSGDLIVRTSGAQSHHFDMPNVLFLGRKVTEIEEMLRSRQVVASKE